MLANFNGDQVAAICNVLATILAVIASAMRRSGGGKGGEK